jgi:hypothetical protein
MIERRRQSFVVLIAWLLLCILACGTNPTPEQFTPIPTWTPTGEATDSPARPTMTPTPTPRVAPEAVATDTPLPASACADLSGNLEMRVLVGPSDVVGLEPFAVGQIPFAVTSDTAPYIIQGGGPISYADVLPKEWGTYAVTMDLQVTIVGECVGEAGAEELQMTVEMTGEQMVEVDAEGFHGEYPWAGTNTLNLVFPLMEGAAAAGEGWELILHLGS